jgi:hypothetical protein
MSKNKEQLATYLKSDARQVPCVNLVIELLDLYDDGCFAV